MTIFRLSVTLVAFVVMNSASLAGVISDTVTSEIDFGGINPWSSSPTSAVVQAGQEFVLSLDGGSFAGNWFGVNVGDTTVRIDEILAGGNTGVTGSAQLDYTVGDLDDNDGGVLIGASIIDISGVSGFDDTDISFTANSLTMNLRNTAWQANSDVTIGLTFGSVPEPSATGLLTVATILMGFIRRKRYTIEE